MATPPVIVIEIGPLDAERQGYPLRYYSEETGGGAWKEVPVAEALIPASLPDATGRGWTPEMVLERLAQDAGVSSKFGEIGEYLAGLLETGAVGPTWKARRNQSYGRGKKVRTVMRVLPEELRRLPWELLRADHRNLFADVANPMYRGVSAAAQAPCESLPLRILIVVGADDAEKATIQWDKELQALRRAMHRNDAVELEELIRPSRQELVTFVEQFRPHVFHFIGHGEMTGHPKEPALILWDSAMINRRAWTIGEIVQDFTAARWTPHLVLLNACRSAQAAAIASENAYELSSALIENGACCVIGMQGDVRGEAAAIFAPRVYECVLKGHSLDSAVAQGRVSVENVLRGTRDWALPALHVACSPHEAIPSEFGVQNARILLTEFASAFLELGDFVDRRNERRQLCWLFLSDDQALHQQNLVIVHGAKEIGKSALVRWSTRHLSLRGRDVHYVDLRGNGGETRTILAAIRRGTKGARGSVLGPLPDPPFATFDRRLAALESGHPEADDPIPQLCEAFIEGLRQLAAAGPLLLILDHFELKIAGVGGTVDPNDFVRELKPLFLDAVAAGTVLGLSVLLVMRDEELQRDETRGLAATARKIVVPSWQASEFEGLARQLVLEEVTRKPVEIDQLIDLFKRMHIPPSFGPAELRRFAELTQLMMRGVQ